MNYAPSIHLHMMVSATNLQNPPRVPVVLEDWFLRLVAEVDMQVLAGPHVTRCWDPGNEGLTGSIQITTSHAAIHVWERAEPAYLRFCLYSCKHFGSYPVIKLLQEFSPGKITWKTFERTDFDAAELVEIGDWPGP